MFKVKLFINCYPFVSNGQVKFKIASCHSALSENRAAIGEVVPIDALSLSLSHSCWQSLSFNMKKNDEKILLVEGIMDRKDPRLLLFL
jgi:hypothetical protein